MLPSNITQRNGDCNHHNRKKILLPKGCEYYSYVACLDCGAFIQWAQDDPKIVEERSERVLMIDQLLNTKILAQGDKEFLNRIKTRRLLIHNESKKYQQMLREYKMN
ncbi:MAG: hypothetical protein KME38_29370 [Spirirestis rafaelensis WJT71-NPBG6]|jgi:hypothetical protein|nr:hypothetical protein [Spirirestis rafaelensis WJT71-NPBG6]